MHYARDGAKPMIDRDRVDEQLSQAAHDWLAWRSDIVDLDTEFAALEGVLAGQSDLRQLDRRHADRTRILAVAASVLILAAGIAAIVWSQGNRHPDSVVPPVDTVEPQITVAPVGRRYINVDRRGDNDSDRGFVHGPTDASADSVRWLSGWIPGCRSDR